MLELCEERLRRLKAGAGAGPLAFDTDAAMVRALPPLLRRPVWAMRGQADGQVHALLRLRTPTTGPPAPMRSATTGRPDLQASLRSAVPGGVSDEQLKQALGALQSMVRGLGIQPGIDMRAGIDAGALHVPLHC
jgi:hypothetical protein